MEEQLNRQVELNQAMSEQRDFSYELNQRVEDAREVAGGAGSSEEKGKKKYSTPSALPKEAQNKKQESQSTPAPAPPVQVRSGEPERSFHESRGGGYSNRSRGASTT